MDLGDFIIPLLIIGSVIVQWLGSGKKPPPEEIIDEDEARERAKSREQAGTRRTARESPPTMAWDDLMEALGQSGPVSPPPLAPFGGPTKSEGRPTPPPLVAAKKTEPVFRREEPRDPFAEQKRRLEESQRQLKEIEQRGQATVTAPNLATSSPSEMGTSRRRSHFNLRARLDDQRGIREAILLNEILQPPVALR